MGSNGWADEAEREACEHRVVAMEEPGSGRIGLMVVTATGSVAARHMYRRREDGVLTIAEMERVRTAADSSAKRLTGRAVRMRRTMQRSGRRTAA